MPAPLARLVRFQAAIAPIEDLGLGAALRIIWCWS